MVEQVCKSCGKTFMRSLYHPQIVLCEECKKGGNKDCMNCKHSKKEVWDLVCQMTGKVCAKSCGNFKGE
ncbi:MAG: hypothetical protein HDQ88_03825 [Clostridia bacterium]|nr:hypothetical protein [Clostridia bacterium]